MKINAKRKAWLAGLKAGDEVEVDGWTRRINRVTPTLFVVGNRRYLRSSGIPTSGSQKLLPSTWLVPPTRTARNRMEHAELADRFGYATDWDALPLATLRRVATVLDKEKRR